MHDAMRMAMYFRSAFGEWFIYWNVFSVGVGDLIQTCQYNNLLQLIRGPRQTDLTERWHMQSDCFH